MQEWVFLDNDLTAWAVALLLVIVLVGGLRIAQRLLSGRLAAYIAQGRDGSLELVARAWVKTEFGLLAVDALYLSSRVLILPQWISNFLRIAAVFALLIQVAIWGDAMITGWLGRYQRRHLEHDAERVTTVRAMGFLTRLLLIVILVLLALDNIPGVEITTLVASLGVGGIAVALAVQNILADLFASLSITLDKPFVIGDFINVGELRGTVEHIGIKTTRLRSLSGEQLVFANNDLLQSRIRNYRRMDERRVAFSLGVVYETPPGAVEQIPGLLAKIIGDQPQVRFDRAHFNEYGPSSLNFEIVYYVLSPDYTLYMDIHQAINLAILRCFAEEGIEFAYPTQTLQIHGATPSS